jgi:ArsR family transcriptional regulator
MLAVRDDTSLDRAVETLKFLSDRNRLRIISVLARSETCVCDLIDELDLPQPLISYHLRKLREAGIVQARRDAQWSYYSLNPDAWHQLIATVSGIFGSASLPPAAAFGSSQRCDLMPADPAHGAWDPSDPDCCGL